MIYNKIVAFVSATRISCFANSTLIILLCKHYLVILLCDTISSLQFCISISSGIVIFFYSFSVTFFTSRVPHHTCFISEIELINWFCSIASFAMFGSCCLNCFRHNSIVHCRALLFIKKGSRRILCTTMIYLSTNGRSSHCYRSSRCCCEIKREIMSITFMHNFHSQTSTVQHICPGVEHTTL